MGHQQYIVKPSSLDSSQNEENNSSGQSTTPTALISEAALLHAPFLTEETLREQGISLNQAIQQVNFHIYKYIIFLIHERRK